MKPDYFKSQLQVVLTTYYEDIKGFRTAAVATRPGSSNADSRTKRTTPATRARTQRTPVQAPARWTPVPAWRTPLGARLSAGAAGAAGGGEAPAAPAPAPSPVGKAGARVAKKKTT